MLLYLGLEILLSYFLYVFLKFNVNGLIIIVHVCQQAAKTIFCVHGCSTPFYKALVLISLQALII